MAIWTTTFPPANSDFHHASSFVASELTLSASSEEEPLDVATFKGLKSYVNLQPLHTSEKPLVTGASLVVTSASLLVTRSYY